MSTFTKLSPSVDTELRRELFLGLTDLVPETRVKANTLANWYCHTYSITEQYLDSFTTVDRAQLWNTLTRHRDVAVAVAEQHTNQASLEGAVATLIAQPKGTDKDDDLVAAEYQFFVQASVYGRKYYKRTNYNPDAFLPGQYLFLAMSFDPAMRAELNTALEAAAA